MKKPQKTYEQIREELDIERARQAEVSAKMANCEHDWAWDITLSVRKKFGKFG